MTKDEFDFETWFENLALHVSDSTGVDFTDMESVREDYENGRDMFNVVDEIVAEYGE